MSEVKNKEVKYKYAIDETGEMVSINQYDNIEEYKHHSYKCVSCGRELLPRALQSKHKQPHFYHKEPVECSGETYLHKLGKYLIKKKFDKEEHFYISLIVKETEECNKIECPLRNPACEKHELTSWHDYPLDLKEYYDTCTEEASIDGKRADLLLTNSKNPQTPPILIEIWYTHQCEDNKIETGHRIIELKIKNEQDIINIYKQAIWHENIQNIAFYSFNNKKIIRQKKIKIHRYAHIPQMNYNGSLFEIYCDESNYKIINTSQVEFNIVPKNCFTDWIQFACWKRMAYNYHFCSCKICKYYKAYNDNPAYCHMSNNYGTPKFPPYDYAKHCQYYRTEFPSDTDSFIIDEVNSTKDDKEIYYVILLIDSNILDKVYISNKIDFYLSNIKKTHKIAFLCYSKYYSIKKINDYCAKHTIPIIEYEIEWEKSKQNAYTETNKKMIEKANALILFRNKGDRRYDSIIELAKQKQIRYAVIES